MITEAQLEKFVSIRNSSSHNTNIQFMFDCKSAGFSSNDLPKVELVEFSGGDLYRWDFPELKSSLIEVFGKLELHSIDHEIVI